MVEEDDAAGAVSRSTMALAALVLGASAIGFGPVFVRIAEVGPVASAFWRVALSVPLLAVAAALGRHRSGRGPLAPLIACGAFFAADLGLWHWSITLTSVANATLLANLNSVFVTLAGFLLFKDRFSRLFLVGLALALLGASALMGENVELAATPSASQPRSCMQPISSWSVACDAITRR
ncbi:MAG: EamA family transporter [Rhodothalassiaceae bacterium]